MPQIINFESTQADDRHRRPPDTAPLSPRLTVVNGNPSGKKFIKLSPHQFIPNTNPGDGDSPGTGPWTSRNKSALATVSGSIVNSNDILELCRLLAAIVACYCGTSGVELERAANGVKVFVIAYRLNV